MTTKTEWHSSTDNTTSYTFLEPSTASGTTVDNDQTPYNIRIPQIHIPSWETVEEPRPGGQFLVEHITEPIENMRKEFDMKLEGMMNQIMERVMQMMLLMPRRGETMPMREGVWCICGNFIPEERKLDRCEYCGK